MQCTIGVRATLRHAVIVHHCERTTEHVAVHRCVGRRRKKHRYLFSVAVKERQARVPFAKAKVLEHVVLVPDPLGKNIDADRPPWLQFFAFEDHCHASHVAQCRGLLALHDHDWQSAAPGTGV